MTIISGLNRFGRRCLAWAAALLGMVLTWIAEGLIRFAAWICDIDPDAEDEYL